LLCAAAAAHPVAQRQLDDDHRTRSAFFSQDLLPLALGIAAGPARQVTSALVAALAPPAYVAREQEVALTLELVERRETEFSVALRLGGRVVSSFYAARYATTRSRTTRLTVTTRNVPPPPDARPAAESSDPH
jgi:hypothetical protein